MIPPSFNPNEVKNPNRNVLLKRKSTKFDSTQPSVNVEFNMDQKNFQMPHDVRSQNNIGIYTNPMMMVMPCETILERNNIVRGGKGISFDKTDYNIKPKNWNNALTFVPELFGITADFSQKASYVSSWVR